MHKEDNITVAVSKNNFWRLAGLLKSGIRLSDIELRKARKDFSKNWAEKCIEENEAND